MDGEHRAEAHHPALDRRHLALDPVAKAGAHRALAKFERLGIFLARVRLLVRSCVALPGRFERDLLTTKLELHDRDAALLVDHVAERLAAELREDLPDLGERLVA